MTCSAAVTVPPGPPALPARQGSLEVCAHSATTSLTASPLPTCTRLRSARAHFPAANLYPKPSMQRPATSFPFAAVVATAKKNPIKNQHWAAL